MMTKKKMMMKMQTATRLLIKLSKIWSPMVRMKKKTMETQTCKNTSAMERENVMTKPGMKSLRIRNKMPKKMARGDNNFQWMT